MQITMCSWGAHLARFIRCSNKLFENWQRSALQVNANKNATDAQGRSVINSRTAISVEYETLFGIGNMIKRIRALPRCLHHAHLRNCVNCGHCARGGTCCIWYATHAMDNCNLHCVLIFSSGFASVSMKRKDFYVICMVFLSFHSVSRAWAWKHRNTM